MGFGFLLVGYMFAFLATAGMGPYIFGGVMVGSIFMFFGLLLYCFIVEIGYRETVFKFHKTPLKENKNKRRRRIFAVSFLRIGF